MPAVPVVPAPRVPASVRLLDLELTLILLTRAGGSRTDG